MNKEDEDTEKDAVGTQNDARLERLSQIADKADEEKSKEQGQEPEEEESEESDESPSPDKGDEREELADDDDETTPQVGEKPKTFKLKLNGVEVEKTEEEVLALAQKVGAADLYLSEAAKAYKASQAPKEPEPRVEEDDLALARAIQMGSEEEAVNAIRKMRERPSFKQDDLTRIVDERLTFQDAATRFKAKYPEVLADPDLVQLAAVKDQQMLADGDSRSYWERFDDIGQQLQKKFGKTSFTDKQARKATVTPIRQASSRAVDSGDQEPDDNPASVIANMAKARGQR